MSERESDSLELGNEDVLNESVGKLFLVGFDGTEVTKEAEQLITKYRVSSMILSGRNFINVPQTKKLMIDLQRIAKESNYEYPIIFAIDQEGGMLNSLFDKDYLTQFPGAMALAATGSEQLVYQVYRKIAMELKSIGFSMFMGPVLDVLKNVTALQQQIVGVRSFGYDKSIVTKFSNAASRAFQDVGILTCGKHFPGYGSAVANSNAELPMILETSEQLLESNLVPFRDLIREDVLDCILVGGCVVPKVNGNDIHACLSPTIVTHLLRDKLSFDGVVLSECLLLEALDRTFGVVQGCISAFSVGCDLLMLCNNYPIQEEAINAFKSVVRDGLLDEKMIMDSIGRIEKLQRKIPSWEEIFGKRDLSPKILAEHKLLSKLAYEKSITVIRGNSLPITKYLVPGSDSDSTILLLTPLISPLYETVDEFGHKSHINISSSTSSSSSSSNLKYGEDVFIEFGQLLADYSAGYKVCHTSYNSIGLTEFHEELIRKAKVIIFVSAETSKNMHQIGVSKHVSMLCNKGNNNNSSVSRQLIIVSVSSPLDFAYDINLDNATTGYICTYDYTINALSNIPKILFGDFSATGKIPGIVLSENGNSSRRLIKKMNNKTDARYGKHSWFVQTFDFDQHWEKLLELLKNNNYLNYSITEDQLTSYYNFFKENKNHKSFIVRNTSSNSLLGISVTWVHREKEGSIGHILLLLVEKSKRNISIGSHLYSKTVKYLIDKCNCKRIVLGGQFPRLFIQNDILLEMTDESRSTVNFFRSLGWDLNLFHTTHHINNNNNINNGSPDSKNMNDNDKNNDKESNDGEVSTIKEEDKIGKISILMNKLMTRHMKYIMRLQDVRSWKVSENLVKQLQVVGIMFDICKNPSDIVELIQDKFYATHKESGINTNGITTTGTESISGTGTMGIGIGGTGTEFQESENVLNFESFEIYLELLKNSQEYFDGNLDIIVALEPSRKNILGCLIVFNNSSNFTKFYPFLKINDKNYSCITGLFIDPFYATLSQVFKLGMICTALMYIKNQNQNMKLQQITNNESCYIIDCEENQLTSLQDNGFKIIGKYHNYYSEMYNWELNI